MFALSAGNQPGGGMANAPRTLPRTVSRDSDVEKSLRGLTDDESIRSGRRGRNRSKDIKYVSYNFSLMSYSFQV